jgi:single-strand selective monofunctional uracil DNA glycosylase
MAQTGVPFGEVGMVRDWLKVRGAIGRPAKEHPKKRVQGFECPRSEVSGARLWGWAKEQFETPRRFFRRFFIANYCPLLFLGATGSNVTPDKLVKSERTVLEKTCDAALRRTVEFLRPRHVIGVGHYAEGCAVRALAGLDVQFGRILHPSPASPAANKDWAAQATRQLSDLGIEVP